MLITRFIASTPNMTMFAFAVVVPQAVQAVEGKSVTLPCDVTPPGHDKVYMVFWFQLGNEYPIYR